MGDSCMDRKGIIQGRENITVAGHTCVERSRRKQKKRACKKPSAAKDVDLEQQESSKKKGDGDAKKKGKKGKSGKKTKRAGSSQ